MSRGDDLIEIKNWRLLACFLWQFGCNIPAVFAWALVAAPAFASVLSLRLWMCALAFSILQVPVTLAHVFVMIPSPAQTTTLFGKQLSPSKLWAALFPNKPSVSNGRQTTLPPTLAAPRPLAKGGQADPWAFAFANTLKEGFRGLCLLAACAASGAATVSTLRWLTLGTQAAASWRADALFGGLLGLVSALRPILRGDLLLIFPPVQRRRFLRIKARLPKAVHTALWVAAAALLSQLALGPVVAGVCIMPPLSVWLAATAVLAAFGWAVGRATVETVLAEQHSFVALSPDAGRAGGWKVLLGAMQQGPQNALIQHLAFQDLATLAEATGGEGEMRRRAIFEALSDPTPPSVSEPPPAWTLMGGATIAPLHDLVAAIRPVVGVLKHQPGGGGSSLEYLSKPPPRQADVAAASWHLRLNFQVCGWALSAIGSLAARARSEDTYGATQLQEPTLSTITSTLLSTLLALRVCMGAATDPALPPAGGALRALGPLAWLPRGAPRGIGGGHHAGSAPNLLHALHAPCAVLADLAQTAVYKLVVMYGADLLKVIDGILPVGTQPAFGDKADHRALLKSMLDFQA